MDRVIETIKKIEDMDFDCEFCRDKIYEFASSYPDVFVEVFAEESKEDILIKFIKKTAKIYSKISTIKAVRYITGMGIKEAKKFVESVVGYDHGDLTNWKPDDEAEALVKKLKGFKQ